MADKHQGPVIVDREEAATETPATAPPVPDLDLAGQAVETAVAAGARPVSRLSRFFWASFAAVLSFWIGVAAWQFVTGLMATYPVLGLIGTVLGLAFLIALALVALREAAGYLRLTRLDRLHRDAAAAIAGGDLAAARDVADRIAALYAGRADVAWGRTRFAERRGEVMDATSLLHLAEAEFLGSLDAAARVEIERAARTVAMVTALVPLALADVFAALAANLRMIRRIGEIYGGRAGLFGGLRLARTVFTHLLATGIVAVGDDLVQSVAGGGLLSKLSRRFGEGVVNGALTARVGVAAIEVCRPLPFAALPRPRVTDLVRRAVTGLFRGGKDAEG
jgi:putative membrane protein